jgi:hypothetical protein
MDAHDWTIVGVTTFVWLVLQIIAGSIIGTMIDRMGDGE